MERRRLGVRVGVSCCLVMGMAVASGPAVASATFVPGTFLVQGKGLVEQGGREIAVHQRPAVASLEGCSTRTVRVRRARGGVRLRATFRCGKRSLRLTARVRGNRMRGTVVRPGKDRPFKARRARSPGIMLAGGGATAAVKAIRDVARAERHRLAFRSKTPEGEVARRELVVLLAPRATVREVNRMLARIGATIVASVRGSRRLAIAIPDPGTVSALRKVAAGLRRAPGVESVGLSYLIGLAAVPERVASPPTSTEQARLSHLLASRMAAAFNARGAIGRATAPTVIVADWFGFGDLPRRHLAASYDPNAIAVGLDADDPSDHGYHVAGIIHADFLSDGTDAGLVTGAYPAPGTLISPFPELVIVDAAAQTSVATNSEIIEAISRTAPGTRLVLNTSYVLTGRLTSAEANTEAVEWIASVRDRGLERRLVHAKSAGNHGESALVWSEHAPAAIRADLKDSAGRAVPSLTNTLVVENATETAGAAALGCLTGDSNFGGTIAAPGQNVWSFKAVSPAGDLTGTSMASPLVAGLATYIWSIAPDLNPQEVIAAIRENPQPAARGCPRAAAPALDGYQAILSLDQPGPPAAQAYPVRHAILDANDDGRFDETDLGVFAPRLKPAPEPSTRDWSRLDLNGDGYTGGTRTAAFDLDRSGSTRAGAAFLGQVSATIEGDAFEFDERAIRDAQILCYYAYSALYAGTDAAAREEALKDVCVRVSVTPATAGLLPGDAQQFTAQVNGATNQEVTWSTDGGTISSSGLYTAPQTSGTYTVTARSVEHPSRKGTATVVVSRTVVERDIYVHTSADAYFGFGPCANSNRADSDTIGKKAVHGAGRATNTETASSGVSSSCTYTVDDQTYTVSGSSSATAKFNSTHELRAPGRSLEFSMSSSHNVSARATGGSAFFSGADLEFDYLDAEFEVTGTSPITVACSITPTNVQALSLTVGELSIDKSNPSASTTLQPGLNELRVAASDLSVNAAGPQSGEDVQTAAAHYTAECHTT